MKTKNQTDDVILNSNKEWRIRASIIAFIDVCIVAVSYFFALLLRFDFAYSKIPEIYIMGYMYSIVPMALCTLLVFYCAKLYHSIWSFASIMEFARAIIANICVGILFVIINAIMKIQMPLSYWVLGWFLMMILTTTERFAYRFFRVTKTIVSQRHITDEDDAERVMIIGAGSAGKTLIDELLLSSYLNAKVCCAIDDNPNKKGRYLDGVPIVGNRYDIPEMVEKYHINKIIFAIPTMTGIQKKEILNICKNTNCEIQTVPGIYQLVNGKVSVSSLRNVEIADLLGRDQIVVDNEGIHDFIHDKVVMVTGGGGSIGSELCRQIAKENPKTLVIFDIYENNAYEIQQELKRKLPEVHIETLIGSVRNTKRVNSVLDQYQPEIIFHAAAHKHVPLMEDSPNEAIKNNVIGTYKMAQAAATHGVKRFVLISTDKAVNPTNIMGASKRLCEMVVQMMNRHSDTEFAAVRFGNVLGSNGSVIPLFKKQIAEGGPVTVTDPNIIRYFMTIPEAVSLVLQAGIYAKGGEIFILDMGEPVRIDDMARNLIRLSGYEPDVDIPIVYTGLRPGEKLYEELLMSEEGLQETPNKLIHIGKPIEMDDEKFVESLKRLNEASRMESAEIKQIVAEVVTTYHPQ